MAHRPAWRAPLRNGPSDPWQSPAFLAKRKHMQFGNDDSPVAKCRAIARSTGKKCRLVALRGSTRCRCHSGLHAAAAAEAERYGRPIIVLRRPRKRSWNRLGHGPMPEGFVWRDDFNELGPVARGRLYEAFLNRDTAPAVWKYEYNRPRPKR